MLPVIDGLGAAPDGQRVELIVLDDSADKALT
jgi:hypothetical protein